MSIYVCSYFLFGFEGRIWDLIVSVPDQCLSFFVEDTIMLCLTCPPSIRILVGSAFKYTPPYDEVKIKFTLTFKKPQSKHKMSVKNYDNLFEYDSNVLPYSQNFIFVSYHINLHISCCLTKWKMAKLHTSVKDYVH